MTNAKSFARNVDQNEEVTRYLRVRGLLERRYSVRQLQSISALRLVPVENVAKDLRAALRLSAESAAVRQEMSQSFPTGSGIKKISVVVPNHDFRRPTCYFRPHRSSDCSGHDADPLYHRKDHGGV